MVEDYISAKGKGEKKYGWWTGLKRLLRMKLVVPMVRLKVEPEVKALGVAVGLFWAMTPLVGIQMWLVFMTWVFFRHILRLNFSLVLGIAYTWVTNVFTMIPVYYVFYITGQVMRGQWDNISGYASLAGVFREVFMQDMGFWEKWGFVFKILLKDWGVSMAVGCLPWAVVCSVVGYYATIRFEKFRKLKMLKRYEKCTRLKNL